MFELLLLPVFEGSKRSGSEGWAPREVKKYLVLRLGPSRGQKCLVLRLGSGGVKQLLVLRLGPSRGQSVLGFKAGPLEGSKRSWS